MTCKRPSIAALTIAVCVVSPVQHAIGFTITDTAGDKSLVTGTSIAATTPWVFTLRFENNTAGTNSELLTSRNQACITGASKTTRRAAPRVPPPGRERRETSSRPTIALHRLLRTPNLPLRKTGTLSGHVRSSDISTAFRNYSDVSRITVRPEP